MNSDRQRELFNLIRDQFFVNPAPGSLSAHVGGIQAHLSVVIGNMLQWYIRGSGYPPLHEALEKQVAGMQLKATELATEWDQQNNQDNKAPLVIGSDLTRSALLFDQLDYPDLKAALPIVDTDTAATVRFNHHFVGELHPQGNIIALAASIVGAFLNENALIPKVSPSVTTWEKEIANWIWYMLEGPLGGSEAGTRHWKFQKHGVEDEVARDSSVKVGSGRIVAGGTIANLTALFTAREQFREWCKKAEKPPFEARPVVLYSSHSHYSIKKGARIVGFVYDKNPTRSEIIRVDGRNYWYVTADDVAEAIQAANARGQYVIMVSVLAGATDTGFVDDLDGIAEIISEYNESPNRMGPRIYYHIDAAMGGPFRLISSLTWKEQEASFVTEQQLGTRHRPRRSEAPLLFDGIQRGDAITIDGHKYFYCNYPCGGIFVRRESDFNYLHEDASYLESGENEEEVPQELKTLYEKLQLDESPLRDLELEGRDRRGLQTLEGSRGIIGIMQLYCTLKVFGPEGITALLQHTIDMTKYLRERIKETRKAKNRPALEMITSGPLNQTLFRIVTNWDCRTDTDQIDLDNQINFLLPYYANWTQTGKLDEKLMTKVRELKEQGEQRGEEIDNVRNRLHSVPFYIGSDQLLGHLPDDEHNRPKAIAAFLDYIWRINDADGGHCPPHHKQHVLRWLSSVKDPKNPGLYRRSLQVLKVVITHPYTDESVLQQFIEDIIESANDIKEILKMNTEREKVDSA